MLHLYKIWGMGKGNKRIDYALTNVITKLVSFAEMIWVKNERNNQ